MPRMRVATEERPAYLTVYASGGGLGLSVTKLLPREWDLVSCWAEINDKGTEATIHVKRINERISRAAPATGYPEDA